MPTHPRKHSDATQVTAEILKEAARFACKWKKKTASHPDRKVMCESGFRDGIQKVRYISPDRVTQSIQFGNLRNGNE